MDRDVAFLYCLTLVCVLFYVFQIDVLQINNPNNAVECYLKAALGGLETRSLLVGSAMMWPVVTTAAKWAPPPRRPVRFTSSAA